MVRGHGPAIAEANNARDWAQMALMADAAACAQTNRHPRWHKCSAPGHLALAAAAGTPTAGGWRPPGAPDSGLRAVLPESEPTGPLSPARGYPGRPEGRPGPPTNGTGPRAEARGPDQNGGERH